MEPAVEDIVIVGAGIAGLSTALGLHRLGLRSLVLESAECLRTTGSAIAMWTNAWRALDALGVGDSLRGRYLAVRGFEFLSAGAEMPTSKPAQEQNRTGNQRKIENRCIRRKELLETLQKEMPQGTIRFSSRVVLIENSGHFKLVHLADSSVIRTKVLIGCDGVNSVVSQWLGLPKPATVGRAAIRGFVEYPDNHSFAPKLYARFGGGIRFGLVPCDDKSIYWFCTYTKSDTNCYEDLTGNPVKMKEFVLSRIGNVPEAVSQVVEKTSLDKVTFAELRMRMPWDILMRKFVDRNLCVAGDALHPMNPDLAQGGCAALEDGVVLARCIGESFKKIQGQGHNPNPAGVEEEEEEMAIIQQGLENYAKERRWRSVSLVVAARVVALIQENDQNKFVRFLREKFLFKYSVDIMMKVTDYDCGKLQ